LKFAGTAGVLGLVKVKGLDVEQFSIVPHILQALNPRLLVPTVAVAISILIEPSGCAVMFEVGTHAGPVTL
jgi:hypothetical protein